MSWIAFTAAMVTERLNSAEVTAMRPLGNDPLPDIVSQVVREVRSRVSAFPSNQVGPAGTIPDELLGAAVARARFELLCVLPVSSLLTEGRKLANENARKDLEAAAAGRLRVEQPATAGSDVIPASGFISLASNRPPVRGHNLRGL